MYALSNELIVGCLCEYYYSIFELYYVIIYVHRIFQYNKQHEIILFEIRVLMHKTSDRNSISRAIYSRSFVKELNALFFFIISCFFKCIISYPLFSLFITVRIRLRKKKSDRKTFVSRRRNEISFRTCNKETELCNNITICSFPCFERYSSTNHKLRNSS